MTDGNGRLGSVPSASRRGFLGTVGLGILGGMARGAESSGQAAAANPPPRRVPLIDSTDLYHPHQDVGDNFDLIAAYGLAEVDLRAVILDVTDRYRKEDGVRDAGFIPVLQLNAIFDRNVPAGLTPYARMRSADDPMWDAPKFQQSGIDLLLDTLRRSAEPVEITVFGSARAVAVAFNREPKLFRERVRRLHLCIGASELGMIEWNVALDPPAFVRLLRSDLPLALYPCATGQGPFAYGRHNCFWRLPDLRFVEQMHPRLQAYLAYAFTASPRSDFLRVVEEPPPRELVATFAGRQHNVWETSVWLQVSNRRLVRRADGTHRIVAAQDVQPNDVVLPNELRPCRLEVRDTGEFTFQLTDRPSNFWIYDRGDPMENERALREALPELYRSFRP